jgi:hypothetical protein
LIKIPESKKIKILIRICFKVIAASGVEDVREVLDYYNKELDPLGAFKLNQVKLQV